MDDDGWGCKTFEIDKGHFYFHLAALYNKERWEAERKFVKDCGRTRRLKSDFISIKEKT